jgi:GNAT superfamily N-acetyltransferase
MMTIQQLDLMNQTLTEELLALQKSAYAIEAKLIGFPNLPPLHETVEELQTSGEIFYGYFVDGELAGAISYKIEDKTLDIHRMMVHPNFFRQGIARQLLALVLALPEIERAIVMTGAANQPAKKLYETFGFVEITQEMVVEGLMIARFEKLRFQ